MAARIAKRATHAHPDANLAGLTGAAIDKRLSVRLSARLSDLSARGAQQSEVARRPMHSLLAVTQRFTCV